eukprot:5813840-Pyramimonas_sp.AAC.1
MGILWCRGGYPRASWRPTKRPLKPSWKPHEAEMAAGGSAKGSRAPWAKVETIRWGNLKKWATCGPVG